MLHGTRVGGSTRSLWIGVAILTQLGLFLAIYMQRGRALVDDAFISFRYASRWASGLDLTWNDGVYVEGYSNPLWTLLLGGVAKLGPEPHRVAPWLGLLSLLAIPFLLVGLARQRGLGLVPASLLVGGVVLDAGLALWGGSGLETALCALLIVLWLHQAAHVRAEAGGLPRGLLLGLLSSGLALSRPEGFVWVLWGFVWLVWGAWARGRLILGWGLGLVPSFGYLVFRWKVFGQLLPNTFFAKMEATTLGWGEALSDLGAWSLAHAAFLVLGLLGISLLRRRRQPHADPHLTRWLLLPMGWFLLQALFVLGVGGDWMGALRYLAPVVPCFYLVIAESSGGLFETRPRLARPVIAGLLAFHLLLGWGFRDVIPEYTRVGEDLGAWLRSVADPDDDTLAVSAAGAIPYFAGLTTYDVLGINDPEVPGRRSNHGGTWAPGHHRFDIDALIRSNPTWIVWDFSVQWNEQRLREYRLWKGDREALDYRRALLAHPQFQDQYRIDRSAPASTHRVYTVYRRREGMTGN